ncbi:hypothetical protein EDB85DRAFT_2146479 [Lactarius pseudohatsudake]|nr:hypothetical protein EDB85DRAFT_2146479 [Lactarius pseudohatsudake]
MGVWTKVNAQRKFVDLINEATFKWANWDPPKVIQIGDFGTIDKKSGELKVEGNIFTHPEIRHIAQDYPAEESWIYKPTSARESPAQSLTCAAVLTTVLSSATPADDQGVVLKSRWQFNTKRGAILLMHKPRLLCVPDGFFDEKFDLPILKRKVVVEQVYNCPGFYMYLSNKASEQISVSLRANTLPGVDGEQALSVGWSADGSSGVCQQGFQEDAVYTPMFRLKSLGRRHWRRDGITPMIEKWEVTYIPWGILDEDGESEESDDDDDDDDDD